MVEKGYPVIWLFIIIILAGYLGSYFNDMHNSRVVLSNTVKKQNAVIVQQQEEIKQLNELIDAMYMYIEAYMPERRKQTPTWPDTSPQNNQPL